MQELTCFTDIENAVEAVASMGDIETIFRKLFGQNNPSSFSKVSDDLYQDLENAAARIFSSSEYDSQSLYDLGKLYLSSFYLEIKDDFNAEHPEYLELLDKASKIDISKVKKEIQSNSNNVSIDIGDLTNIANSVSTFYNHLTYLKKIWREEDEFYGEVKKYLADKINEKLSEEFMSANNFDTANIISYSLSDFTIVDKNIEAMIRKMFEFREKFSPEAEDKFPIYKNLCNEFRSYTKEFEENGKKLMEQVQDALMLASGISQAEADKWVAEHVSFDRAALKKLDRNVYKKDELLADLSKIYRIVGGKLGKIKFINTKGDRSFANANKMRVLIK